MRKPLRRLPVPRAMIVAPQPEAVEAGADILRAGGSAVDAVLACAFTQGVVDPLMCGVGGLGVLHVYDPKTETAAVIDGLSTCPARCTPHMWEGLFKRECADGFGYEVEGHVNELGHRAVTVPGILRTLDAAHRSWGRLPWNNLFGPAIAFATDGWIVRPHVSTMFQLDERAVGRQPFVAKLAFSPYGRDIYLRPDGTPKRAGELIRNPELARTLSTIQHEGAEAFYAGALARTIVDDMQKHDGLLAAQDLADYQPRRLDPIRFSYRGRTIAVPPPPSGGVVVAQILRILERFDLAAMEHNGPEYIRVFAEAMKIAGRDRDAHLGDPAFVSVPVERLLSDAYADECAERIRRDVKTAISGAFKEAKDTTTISCVDADGMVATMTHTLATPSGVIPPGTGFMLNGAMNWYDPRPNRAGSIAPGKKRFSTMSPTIVFEPEGGRERPSMTVGAPGGAWIAVAIAQTLVNVLDWGMTMQEAVSAPRFSATTNEIDISNRISHATQRQIEAFGYGVRRNFHSYPFAAVHGITMFDGVLQGGADPQRDGHAAAVS